MLRKARAINYGWYIVFALAVTETVSWGIIYYAFSVFIVPTELEFGWTRAQISGAFSLALLVSGVMAVPVGYWLDRFGGRGLMTAGSIAAVGLYYAQSQVTTLTGFYLTWLGLGITMAMVLYEPSFVVAAKWFHNRLGTALAVITFAAGFASTIFLPLSNHLLEAYGREQAQIILAAILAAITIPLHALVLRKAPELIRPNLTGGREEVVSTPEPTSSLTSTLRSPLFWFIAIGFSLANMAAIGVRVHMIPLLLDRGFSAETAAATTGIIGAMQVVGRLLYAPVGGRLPGRRVLLTLFSLLVVSLAILRFIQTMNGVWAFVILAGAVHGALTLARPAMIADLYGSEKFGRISSVMTVMQRFATTVAPYGVGVLYGLWGDNYDPVLIVLIVIALVSVAVISRVGNQR